MIKVTIIIATIFAFAGCNRVDPNEIVLKELKETKAGIIRYDLSDSKIEDNPEFYEMLKYILQNGKVVDMGYPWHEGIQGFALVFNEKKQIVLSAYIRNINIDDWPSTDIYFCSPKSNITIVIPRCRAEVVFDEVKRSVAPNQSLKPSP